MRKVYFPSNNSVSYFTLLCWEESKYIAENPQQRGPCEIYNGRPTGCESEAAPSN